ncbi:MAG TPA: hypothetical protein PL033_12990 [Candidatus Brocadiia bacterium]|nr:hypothetical protein [Candidatus Brocadiia bacterium]
MNEEFHGAGLLERGFGQTAVILVSILLLQVARVAFAENSEQAPAERERTPMKGILYNEDDSHRFILAEPGKLTKEHLTGLVDELANSQVSAMLICCNAQRVNFPSKVWQWDSDGFDPAQGDDQPFFGDISPEARVVMRKWAHNAMKLIAEGVDPTGIMLDRCREQGISPWVSIRMNDIHDADLIKSPLHCAFWNENPQFWRYSNRFTAWTDRSFDYGQKPVRDRAMKLIVELCERDDMEGLELDWMRFPLHFREGEEQAKAKELTEWMREVRLVVNSAAKKRGHPILLVARVAARPEVASGIGTDAVTWAKEGLIDHLVVAPFWATTDFDIPVEKWVELLAGTGVGVTAGLEIRVQPHPGSEVVDNTPERRRGAALSAMHRGSQGIYVFNYFEMGGTHPELLQQMGSIETLLKKNRSHVVTYCDTCVPGKPIPAPLPRIIEPGAEAVFFLHIGPKPANARAEIVLEVKAGGEDAAKPEIEALLNGKPGQLETEAAGLSFAVGGEAFKEGYNEIAVRNKGAAKTTVTFVELRVICAPEQ